jgi:hypothetical protein
LWFFSPYCCCFVLVVGVLNVPCCFRGDEMSQTCDIGPEILDAFKKFKMSKSRTLNLVSFKINVKELKVSKKSFAQ